MYKITDGNNACAEMSYNFIDQAFIYPITPSSPMASHIDELINTGKKNIFDNVVDLTEMQSESGVAGALHGSLLAGSLACTYTSSQGLLLMIPNMYKIAGEMLPAVIHVSSRALSTHALSIEGDHQDIYATRQTGFCMLASSNVEDTYNLSLVAHLSAIESSLPFLHFFDGFRTSHEINKIETLTDEQIKSLINMEHIKAFQNKSLNINNPFTKGASETHEIYFQITESRNQVYENVPKIVENIMQKVNNLTGKDYQPFNYYGKPNAEYIIVAMGSISDTIKNVIDNREEKLGLIEVHLYRPFSAEHLLSVLPNTTKAIAVLDRTKESGSIGEPLYLDVLATLQDKPIKVYGGRFGLSGKDTTPSDIYAVYNMLKMKPKNNFTIGIKDDLTNTSLEPINFQVNDNYQEIKVYGYASDGLVSSSKDFLKIMGENLYVQGFFNYDSRKSGGLTESHLRLSSEPIKAPYLLTHPEIIIVSKEEYLSYYEIFSNIENDGIVLINTNKTDEEISQLLTEQQINLLKKRNVKIYKVPATTIASKNNLKNKTGSILESCLFNLLNRKDLIIKQKENIKSRFFTRGTTLINDNIKAIEEAEKYITPVILTVSNKEEHEFKDIFEAIAFKQGNTLTTSNLKSLKEGTYPAGLINYANKINAEQVPHWIEQNCISCNFCSLICPHGAITPKIIDGKEKIFIDTNICTGCGLCINICPGKQGNKALEFGEFYKTELIEDDASNKYDKFTIKGSQHETKKFKCPGACAGCGETPYIRLLTQLYHNIIIANATGCSSIYGASSPYTPYKLPWANSLFEDNAEFALGIHKSITNKRKQLEQYLKDNISNVSEEAKKIFTNWLINKDNQNITTNLKEELVKLIPEFLHESIIPQTVWAIGGDGWAYDIGFSGIDHILSSNENINILVLDSEVYSNTGGQSSKATRKGAVAEFNNLGKRTPKKDLFKIAMTYPNVYVASICLGANMMQSIKAFKEATEHNGPSIIIAYCPCVEQGIRTNALIQEKLSIECGYNLLMRYKDNKLLLDSPKPNFNKYEEFLNNETRYTSLKLKDKYLAETLLEENKKTSMERYQYYSQLSTQ